MTLPTAHGTVNWIYKCKRGWPVIPIASCWFLWKSKESWYPDWNHDMFSVMIPQYLVSPCSGHHTSQVYWIEYKDIHLKHDARIYEKKWYFTDQRRASDWRKHKRGQGRLPPELHHSLSSHGTSACKSSENERKRKGENGRRRSRLSERYIAQWQSSLTDLWLTFMRGSRIFYHYVVSCKIVTWSCVMLCGSKGHQFIRGVVIKLVTLW